MEIDKLKKNELLDLCKEYPESEYSGLKVPELKEYLKGKLQKTGKKKRLPNDLVVESGRKFRRIDYVKKYR